MVINSQITVLLFRRAAAGRFEKIEIIYIKVSPGSQIARKNGAGNRQSSSRIQLGEIFGIILVGHAALTIVPRADHRAGAVLEQNLHDEGSARADHTGRTGGRQIAVQNLGRDKHRGDMFAVVERNGPELARTGKEDRLRPAVRLAVEDGPDVHRYVINPEMALPLGHDGREFDGNHQPFVPPGTAGRRGGVRSISKTGWIAGVESHFYLGEQLLDRRSTRILRAVQKQRGQADQKQPFFHLSQCDHNQLQFSFEFSSH